MGSVKDLIVDDSLAGRLYVEPTADEFGKGAWKVSGRFSVGDLKEQIHDSSIANKAEALTMTTARFFEWLADNYPDIPTCYLGVLDKDGKVTDTKALLQRGETTDMIVMRLAHTPQTFCGGDLEKYRTALTSGVLRCGVADVESIFRKGFPLGSSTFEKIAKACKMSSEYDGAATYDETVEVLSRIRKMRDEYGKNGFINPKVEDILIQYNMGSDIPNPGFVLKSPVYDSTTKFESSGDRFLTKGEESLLSGLDQYGYPKWVRKIFPELAEAQIKFCGERGILNLDGKVECVAYMGSPVVTDFACTSDENRLMIITKNEAGEEWAIPSNKEIQRAIFRQAGVYSAISAAKKEAEKDGDAGKWKKYIPKVTEQMHIDLKAVSEHSCNLMAYAISEVANRILEKKVFDAKPLDSWVPSFMPYASRIEYQK